jgi:cobalt-zinc-cadmium efflux system outer membrane protein
MFNQNLWVLARCFATSGTDIRRLAAWLVAPLLGLLLGLASAPAVQAQTQVQAAQTLAQALDAAWARQPQAVTMTARLAEAQAGVDVAQGITPGPASVSINHLNDRFTGNGGRREWELEWATPMWLPGQHQAQQAVAEQAQAEVQARSAALKLQLADQVREAWWALAQARSTQGLARQRLATAQALAQTVQRRFKAGDLARLDANLAQTEQLAAQAELIEADQAVQQAHQAYRHLVGAEAPATLAPEAEPVAAADPASSHPQLQALQIAVALANSRVILVDASQRDAPELAVRWTNQRSDGLSPYDQAVGLKLTIPLSSDGRTRREGAAARAELAQAETEWALAQSRVQQDVQMARAEWSAAQRQLSMAQERRALTLDSLQLAQRAFGLGESDLVALMRARAAEQEAQAWLKRQEVASHRALSRLHQAQGVLP